MTIHDRSARSSADPYRDPYGADEYPRSSVDPRSPAPPYPAVDPYSPISPAASTDPYMSADRYPVADPYPAAARYSTAQPPSSARYSEASYPTGQHSAVRRGKQYPDTEFPQAERSAAHRDAQYPAAEPRYPADHNSTSRHPADQNSTSRYSAAQYSAEPNSTAQYPAAAYQATAEPRTADRRSAEFPAAEFPATPYPAAEPTASWAAARVESGPPSWTPPPADNSAVAAGPQGAPAPVGRPKSPKAAMAGAIVAVALASAGITAGIMAATGGTATATTAGPGGGQGQGLGRGAQAAASGVTSELHGTYVVAGGNGTYTTELSQTGTVSAVSASSITVKSADGFSKTYVISSATSVDNGADKISAVLSGHTVSLVATSADTKVTSIVDTNLATTTQQGGGQGAPNGNGGPGAQPNGN